MHTHRSKYESIVSNKDLFHKYVCIIFQGYEEQLCEKHRYGDHSQD